MARYTGIIKVRWNGKKPLHEYSKMDSFSRTKSNGAQIDFRLVARASNKGMIPKWGGFIYNKVPYQFPDLSQPTQREEIDPLFAKAERLHRHYQVGWAVAFDCSPDLTSSYTTLRSVFVLDDQHPFCHTLPSKKARFSWPAANWRCSRRCDGWPCQFAQVSLNGSSPRQTFSSEPLTHVPLFCQAL